MDEDRTLSVSSLFPLSIRVEKGQVVKRPVNFPTRFVVGRGEGSDLQFSDSFVGRAHAEIWFDRGQWWVKDLGSVNKTFVNGEELDGARPLPSLGTMELGKDGVVLSVSVGEPAGQPSPTPFTQQFLAELTDESRFSPVEPPSGSSEAALPVDSVPKDEGPGQEEALGSSPAQEVSSGSIDDFLSLLKRSNPSAASLSTPGACATIPESPVVEDREATLFPPGPPKQPASPAQPSTLTGYIHDLVRDEQLSLEEKGQKIRDAVRGKLQHHARWYHWIIAGLSCVAIVVGGWAMKNHLEIQALRENAAAMFSSIKAQQMEVLRIEAYLTTVASPEVLQDVKARREAIQLMYKDYDAYLEQIGVYQSDLSEGDQIILRMARLFGECEVDMPADFAKDVKRYIRKWQSTPRFREAIQRAISHRYPQKVNDIMLHHGLPPQFFYLALQESDFDVRKVGPSRPPYGIAKGPWQFMPATAMDYKLHLGPLVEHPRYDPQDERHDFHKSTIAAAQHLLHLYTTEAQASSLLVLASYNWGQGNVKKVITAMPENPRERNFWRLLKNFKIPRETYNYVMYIFSAVVIGENPRLWGFDFDNPLPETS